MVGSELCGFESEVVCGEGGCEVRVVNLKKGEKFDVYIGRGSVFGNRFVIGRDGNRSEVIEKYRVWLWGEVKRGGEVVKRIEELRGNERLGCFCGEGKCHGDVIVRCWKWLKSVK